MRKVVKMKRRIAMSLAVALAVAGAWADTATVNGITWKFTVSGGKAKIYKQLRRIYNFGEMK